MARLRRVGRAFERFLGMFDVVAGYGTRRRRTTSRTPSRQPTRGGATKR